MLIPILVPVLYVTGTLLVTISLLWLLNIASEFFDEAVVLSADESARMALAAPYFVMHAFSEDTLQGKRPLARQWIRCLLFADWAIASRASARDRLDWLAASGARNRARNGGSQPICVGVVVPATGYCADVSRNTRSDANEEYRSLLAWDVMRLVFVARCCASVGLITPQEFWRYLDRAGDLAGHYFSDWESWFAAFLRGRRLWAGHAGRSYEWLARKLMGGKDNAWSRVTWEAATNMTYPHNPDLVCQFPLKAQSVY